MTPISEDSFQAPPENRLPLSLEDSLPDASENQMDVLSLYPDDKNVTENVELMTSFLCDPENKFNVDEQDSESSFSQELSHSNCEYQDSSSDTTDSSDSASSDNSLDTFCHAKDSHTSHCHSLLSCFTRNNLPASTCKDILKTIKDISPQNKSLTSLTYDSLWDEIEHIKYKEFHYCIECLALFPEDEDVFHCSTESCNGTRYKGPLTHQTKSTRTPKQSFLIASVAQQLRNLLQSPGTFDSY